MQLPHAHIQSYRYSRAQPITRSCDLHLSVAAKPAQFSRTASACGSKTRSDEVTPLRNSPPRFPGGTQHSRVHLSGDLPQHSSTSCFWPCSRFSHYPHRPL